MIPKVTENTFVDGLDEDTVAWKKAFIWCRDGDDRFLREAIVKLIIPKDAKLVLSPYNKCRASYVKVEGIYPVLYTVDEPDPMSVLKNNIAGAWYAYPFFTFAYAVGLNAYPGDRLFEPGPSKKLDIKLAFSAYNTHFWYEDGKIATPDSFDPDPDIECSHGIHFFRTYEEARQYCI